VSRTSAINKNKNIEKIQKKIMQIESSTNYK